MNSETTDASDEPAETDPASALLKHPAEIAVRQFSCSRCGARPGQFCRTGSRRFPRKRYRSHNVRIDALIAELHRQQMRPRRLELDARYERERSFACEECGAAPGEKCRGQRKQYLTSTHRSRQIAGGNPHVTL